MVDDYVLEYQFPLTYSPHKEAADKAMININLKFHSQGNPLYYPFSWRRWRLNENYTIECENIGSIIEDFMNETLALKKILRTFKYSVVWKHKSKAIISSNKKKIL